MISSEWESEESEWESGESEWTTEGDTASAQTMQVIPRYNTITFHCAFLSSLSDHVDWSLWSLYIEDDAKFVL